MVSLPLCAQSYIGIGAGLGGFARSGNWADTYGNSLLAETRVEGGLNSGWYAAARVDVMFGNDVKVDPITELRSDFGQVFGDAGLEGGLAEISLKSRGFRYGLLVGYQHEFAESGWGVRGAAGPSYLLHFIRIQDDANLNASNLRSAYKRGYDRRAAGFGGSIEIGGQYTNTTGSLIVFAVATADVARTEPLNSTQFDLQAQAPGAGTDTALGLRIGFVLGLVRGAKGKADDIYY